MKQVAATNIGVCVPIDSIEGICFVYHGEEVEANPPPILKGLNNGYFVLYDLHFYMNNTIFFFDNLLQSHHVTFSHQWHPLSLPHSYNQRIYLGLCLLSKLVNSQLFSVRLYERPRFSIRTNFSLECWEYLVSRLKGGG